MMSRDITKITSAPGQGTADPEGRGDRAEQRLVGERIKVGAKFALHPEPLGKVAIHGIAQSGQDEEPESDQHFASHDRPHHDRH